MKTIFNAVLSVFALAALAVAPALAQTLETSSLTIESANGSHAFTVEIADEPEEISYGLMDRQSLEDDAGMLFDFGAPREPAMWMKNTLIPLDMLFISSDGTVQMIARNTVPGSLRTISPGMPVKAVLEINAGQSAELGIEPGDTVIHPVFDNDEG